MLSRFPGGNQAWSSSSGQAALCLPVRARGTSAFRRMLGRIHRSNPHKRRSAAFPSLHASGIRLCRRGTRHGRLAIARGGWACRHGSPAQSCGPWRRKRRRNRDSNGCTTTNARLLPPKGMRQRTPCIPSYIAHIHMRIGVLHHPHRKRLSDVSGTFSRASAWFSLDSAWRGKPRGFCPGFHPG